MFSLPSSQTVTLLTGYCKTRNKGWVKNRLSIVKYSKKISNPTYIILVPEFNETHPHLKGSITWGMSGTTFSVKMNEKLEVRLDLSPHEKCILNKKEISELIVSVLVFAIQDIEEKLNKKSKGGTFREPQLAAIKRNGKIPEESRHKIMGFKNTSFSPDFCDFLIKHLKDGIRCKCKRQTK